MNKNFKSIIEPLVKIIISKLQTLFQNNNTCSVHGNSFKMVLILAVFSLLSSKMCT